jgi:hypothetical protein
VTRRFAGSSSRCIHNAGVKRRQAQGERFSQADYCAGAMGMFFALGIQDQIPAAWIMGHWAGQELFTEPMLEVEP